MAKSNLDSPSLASVLIAAAAGLLLIPAGFTWLASLLGLVLLLILLGYDEEGYRSVLQSVAFAAACAFCLTLASIVAYQYVYGLPSAREPQLTNRWLPLTFAFTTLLFAVIDRARMGARAVNVQPGAATLGSVYAPRPSAAPQPVSIPVSAPVTSTPVTSTPVTSAPVTSAPVMSAPVMSAPVMSAPVMPNQPMRFDSPAPPLVRNEAPTPPIPPPAPAPPPVQLTDIYVHLTGESLNLMRSVRAEPLGRDYYRIVDTMPENEMWQFMPGQVVRCKKQNLSTGKAMVAIGEAPRAH